MYMVYPDKIYVASADALGPVGTSASAVYGDIDIGQHWLNL